MKFRASVFALFVSYLLLSLPLFAPETQENAQIVFNSNENIFIDRNAVYVSASAAVLMDADSGRILYAKNENVRLPMASTTKIMTCLLASECLDPETTVTVPKETADIEGSSIYLAEGEKIKVKELLLGLMLRSGNDAANTLAYAVSGSVDEFVLLMNLKAKSLGLENTSFANPSGLPAENHYTSARDLAFLASSALKNELFASVVGEKSAVISDGKRYLVNRNKLLFTYEGMIGVKTGYTPEAGKCLVTAARRNGVTLVAVTLNDGNEWNDHVTLLNYGFANYESVVIPRACCACGVFGSEKTVINAVSGDDFRVTLPKNARYEMIVPQNVMLYSPISKGDIVSYAEIICENETVSVVPLYADENAETKKYNTFERLFK